MLRDGGIFGQGYQPNVLFGFLVSCWLFAGCFRLRFDSFVRNFCLVIALVEFDKRPYARPLEFVGTT